MKSSDSPSRRSSSSHHTPSHPSGHSKNHSSGHAPGHSSRRGPHKPGPHAEPHHRGDARKSSAESAAIPTDAAEVTSAAATDFASLGLAGPLLESLKNEGYTTPTPIQARAIPPVLAGRDVLGCAQTGTGKTAAFALPILQRLHAMPADKSRRGPALPRALILSPTRELATQIAESFATYGRHTTLTGTVIFGGVSQFHQVKALHRGVDILVATPGRLIDLMEQKLVNLSHVSVFVLDEADRMLDMGFIQPIRRIAAALPNSAETPRQTLLFSATMPKEIMHLADSLLRNPVKVAVTPVASMVPLIEQSLYMVPRTSKQALLHHLLQEGKIARAVVFTKTKHGADRVARKLGQAGITAEAIHGNKAQNQRQRALDAFKVGRSRVLVATDVAARGLDVDGITHVFNFDLPMEPEAYVHRIGRTGRAGATGEAISFCDHEERGLLRDIEKLTGKKIPCITQLPALPPLPEAKSDRAAEGWNVTDRPVRPMRASNAGHGSGHGSSGHGSGHGPRAGARQPARQNRDHHHTPQHAPRGERTASGPAPAPGPKPTGMRQWSRPVKPRK